MIYAFLSIEYDEGDQSSYRAVKINVGHTDTRFSTGDPVQDLRDARDYVLSHHGGECVESTSLIQFARDGDVYKFDTNGHPMRVKS